MKNVFHLLVMMLTLLSGSVLADNSLPLPPPLRSAAESDYPPFSIVKADGTADGLAVELLQESLSAMGREASFKTAPWNQIKNELATGELDVLPLVGRTPERTALYDFTVPYLTLHGALFVRGDESRIKSLADLPGKRIAVMKGDNAEEYVLRAKLSDQIISTTSFEEAFNLLSSGGADAVIAQKLMGISLLKQLGLRNIRVVGRPNEEFKQDFCFAVKKGHAELLAELNEGLAVVVANGTQRPLMSKWLGTSEISTARSRVLFYGDDPSYPPYMFLDEQERPSGFHVELLQAIAVKTGLLVAFRPEPWSEVRRKMRDGELDITSMLYTLERDRLVDFSLPHSVEYAAVFTRTGAPPYQPDLKECRIAVQNGDMLHEYAVTQGWGETLSVTESLEETMTLLADGQVDFALCYHIPGLQWIRKNGWKNIRTAEPRLMKTEYCFAVQEGNQPLLNLLNAGLRELKQTGEYQTIYNKWLGAFDETNRPLPLWFWMVVCGVGGGAILLFGANRLLKHQVKKRTAELRESEECFEIAVEAGNIGVWDLDLVHDRLIWDDRMYRLYGIRKEDFGQAYDAWAKCVHPDDLERTAAEVAAAERGENPLDTEFRIIRPDNGTIRHIRASGKVIRKEDGTASRMIGTNQDITERKTADQTIEVALKRLQKIADQVPGVIYQFCLRPDGSSYFPYASDKIREIYQVTPEQIREDASAMFKKIPPDDYADLVESIQTSARDLTPWTYEYRAQGDDGTVRWLSGQSVPQKEPDGSVLWHGFITDITERKKMESALVQKAHEILQLKDFSIGLSTMASGENLEEYIAKKLREICGAIGVSFNVYHPERKVLIPLHVEVESKLFDLVQKQLKNLSKDISSPVSDEMFRMITTQVVGVRKTLHEITYGAFPKPIGAAIQKVLKADRFIAIPYFIEGKLYGTSVIAMGKDVPDPSRELLENLALLSAVTLRRKQAEKALRESESRFKALHNATFGGIAIHDQGVILECNLGLSKLTGYSAEELIGMDGVLLIAEESREMVQERIRSGYDSPYEADGVRKNGDKYSLRLAARNIPYKGIQARVVEFRDITERKQAEIALYDRNNELVRFNKAAVGRELRMVELKKEINALCRELGKETPYPLHIGSE